MLQENYITIQCVFLPKLRSSRRRFKVIPRRLLTCWQNKSSLEKMLWSPCWGRWLCSSSWTTLKLLKFRLQTRIICQHEYNFFSHLRFPCGEGGKIKTNNLLLIIYAFAIQIRIYFSKIRQVLRGSNYPEKQKGKNHFFQECWYH